MEKIASFTIDHLRLKKGVYVSRIDKVGDNAITTFDIRMKTPYKEPVLAMPELHTIEHLAATFLRSCDEWKDKVVYFGPMGCQTGNYMLLSGQYTSHDIVPLVKKLFEFIANFEGDIPGATAVECGNCFSNNLPMAKYEAKKYLDEVLNVLKEENLNYPE